MKKSFNSFVIRSNDNIGYKFPIDISFDQEHEEEQATDLNTDFNTVVFDKLAEHYNWPIDESGLIISKNKYVAVKTATATYKLPVQAPAKRGNMLKDILPVLAEFYNWEKVERTNDTK